MAKILFLTPYPTNSAPSQRFRFEQYFSFFKDEEAIFKTFINDFKAETPATIKSPAIDSRITVLETKLLKLHDSANLDNIDKKVVLKDIKDLFVAFTNLNLQINKKLEFESQVIEKPY